MIVTRSNDPATRLTVEDCRLVMEECDSVTTYMEAGWFCVLGYKGDRRLVNAYCGSEAEYLRMSGNLPEAPDTCMYGSNR